MLCSTVEQRVEIQGGKSEGCTSREANAAEPQNPSEYASGYVRSLRRNKNIGRNSSDGRMERHVQKQVAHSATALKPFPCSSRDSDWKDRTAWNCSTSCSAGVFTSLRTCSPARTAAPAGRPRLTLQIFSCPTCSFDSSRTRRLGQRKDTSFPGLQTLFLVARPGRREYICVTWKIVEFFGSFSFPVGHHVQNRICDRVFPFA